MTCDAVEVDMKITSAVGMATEAVARAASHCDDRTARGRDDFRGDEPNMTLDNEEDLIEELHKEMTQDDPAADTARATRTGLHFPFWKYLRFTVRAGADVLFQFGVVAWLMIIATFVCFIFLRCVFHMGYIRIMSFFIFLLFFQLLSIAAVIRNTRRSVLKDSLQHSRNSTHNSCNSEGFIVHMVFDNVFVLCYDAARIFFQPWVWKLHFDVVCCLPVATSLLGPIRVGMMMAPHGKLRRDRRARPGTAALAAVAKPRTCPTPREQVRFAAHKQFCDDTTLEKKRAIAKANEQIDVLEATFEISTTANCRLLVLRCGHCLEEMQTSREIAEHDEDISVCNGDIEAVVKVREIKKADYGATRTDYFESVDAAGSSLGRLLADLVVSTSEANAYEFQFGGVIEVLEKLLDKSIAERTTREKEEFLALHGDDGYGESIDLLGGHDWREMNSKHAHDVLMQNLEAQMGQAIQDRDEKSEVKAETLPSKADAKGDLEAIHEQKASDFEARQRLRAEAIGKAIEIISSGAVSGNADQHLPGLPQQPALVQLRVQLTSANLPRIASYHPERARTLGSCVLSALAVRVKSDLFAKVEKMIEDFIVKLMEEVNEESEHNGWCDTDATAAVLFRGRMSCCGSCFYLTFPIISR